MPTEIKHFGRHSLEITDDLVVTRMIGDFTIEDTKAFYALVIEASKGAPVYSIGDVTRAGILTAEARRYAVEYGHTLNLQCNVVFGMNTLMRSLLILLTHAARLISRAKGSMVTVFVATEADARAHVNALRARHSSASAASR